MNDPTMKPEAAAASVKKDRSPSFPFITLTKAIDRTRELFDQAKRHEMRMADAAGAMKYGPKSSGTIQTLAALVAFGLIEDSGSGEARKFRVSDLGFKILADQRPGARETALAEAALKPKLISEYAVMWWNGRPSDAICLSELHIDRGFSEDGAKTFLRVFDDAMSYAKIAHPDKNADTDNLTAGGAEPPSQSVAVGDLVRVEVNGQIVVEKAAVRDVQEHAGRSWVFVEGTETGALVSDVTLLEKTTVAAGPPTLPLPRPNELAVGQPGEEMDRFTVDEGVVKITFPAAMTSDSVDDLKAFFDLFIKKAKRRAGANKNAS